MSSGLFMKMHRMDSPRTLIRPLGWLYFYWGNFKNMAFCGCWTLYDAVLVQTILWYIPWWRHQMESFSALLALCAGIHRSPVNSPHKGQWRGALMFSLICALNKRFSKQSWGWWFKTPLRSLWRHCNAKVSWELSPRQLMGMKTRINFEYWRTPPDKKKINITEH